MLDRSMPGGVECCTDTVVPKFQVNDYLENPLVPEKKKIPVD
jgi:hypothetical protein